MAVFDNGRKLENMNEITGPRAQQIRESFLTLLDIDDSDLLNQSVYYSTSFEELPWDRIKIDNLASSESSRIFQECNIKPSGDLVILRLHSNRQVFSFTPEQFASTGIDWIRKGAHDILIKDNSSSWVVFIDHDGGVSFKKNV